jgi:hypothetical protein
MTYAVTVTPLGIIKCLREISSAPNGELSVVVNPEAPGRGSGPRFDVFRAGEMNAGDRVAHFRSAVNRGLIVALPADVDDYGNRIQVLQLTPLGHEVLDGSAEMPLAPGEQAGGGEVGIGAGYRKAAEAIKAMERLQREGGEIE